ncbi:MAG TPA: CoA transferase [Usitatibacter sp.]|nr:CoA transferase [Usitatibacter sp.]
MSEYQPQARGPLDGLVVIDLTRLVSGNMLSLQLADFGAEVIKIEDPGKGDPLRDWRVEGVSAYWKVYARNKKSATLNLRSDEGKALLLELAARADVLLENFRPGTLEAMGLAPSVLHARNPGLVVVRISGWGQDGPYRQRPGFGTLVEGMSGFAAKNGFDDREPVLPPLALADMIAGLYGAFATLAALRYRDRGGPGQVIDLPLLDSMFSVLGPEAAIFQLTHQIPKRRGSRSSTAGPRNVFRTKDGRWIAMSASMQAMTARLYTALGVAQMLEDPRFRTNAARVANAEAAEAPVRDFVAAHTLEECMAFFEKNEITAAPVYEIDQFMADPHVRARRILFDLPDKDMGTIPMHAVVPRLSGSPGAVRHPAPELGEHTAEVLARLGVDEARRSELARRKVI